MEKYRTALILGYGRSGKAAERLLLSEGCEVVVLSQERNNEAVVFQRLEKQSFDVCIVSPGFGLSHPWICAVRDAGIELLSELELGWSRHSGKTVAVTGSNGKSTAVKWICEMFQRAGRRAEIGGNYGVPACEVVLEHPALDWLVLEVSSFQLETVKNFHAEVALVLNVLPNHLDRHETMECYRHMKARIFGMLSCSKDVCLVPFDLLAQFRADTVGERRWITFGESPEADYSFNSGTVFQGLEPVLGLSGTLFDSPILGSCTGAAVAAVADAAGIEFSLAEAAARGFKPLPHRLERLGELNGVVYVNDSKATNLAATAAAVQACGKDLHLIAGGLPKESDYSFIKEILAERVRKIYLVGRSSRAMFKAWSGVCPCVECGTLEVAFSTARSVARKGETILLSPGCASFDQFRSFEKRGERFFALFRQVAQGEGDGK